MTDAEAELYRALLELLDVVSRHPDSMVDTELHKAFVKGAEILSLHGPRPRELVNPVEVTVVL